jgi:preprotein translocase subunit SecE
MGRLQRKKPISKKKKKKQSVDAVASQPSSGLAVVGKSSAAQDLVKESKKKPVPSQTKTSAVIRTSLGSQKNFWGKTLQFLREVKIELKKVTWPSRKQTIGSTVVVIVLVLIISLFLGVVDIGLTKLVRVVLQ